MRPAFKKKKRETQKREDHMKPTFELQELKTFLSVGLQTQGSATRDPHSIDSNVKFIALRLIDRRGSQVDKTKMQRSSNLRLAHQHESRIHDLNTGHEPRVGYLTSIGI